MKIKFSLNRQGDNDCTRPPVYVQTYALAGEYVSQQTMRHLLETFLCDALGKSILVMELLAVDAVEYGPFYQVEFGYVLGPAPLDNICLINAMITTDQGKPVNAIHQKRFKAIFKS